MPRTYARQDTQIRRSDLYNDALASTEAIFETNPVNIEDDLNNIRSKLHLLQKNGAGNWFDAQVAPAALEAGVLRGADDLNVALHAVEKKRILREVHNLTDVTVTAAQNWEVLGVGELPAQLIAAVGAVTTLGTVVAPHGGTFGTTHSLAEVAGTSALAPLNLMVIVDGATRDPILSGGRQVYGLFQGEASLTDGNTITASGGAGDVQISFVRPNATGDDLEACPVVDIAGLTINYCTRERVRLEDLNEADFLSGAIFDVGAGAGTIDRQTAYTNQGTTPVNLVTNALLDLEGPGLAWTIRDDLEAMLFQVVEGSAGGTSQFNIGAAVDEFDVDAVVNNFLNGISVDTGAAGTTINVGVTANKIDSGGDLTVEAATNLILDALAGEVRFDDSYRAGSTWAQGYVPLAESSQEWSDYETEFGEVSLMNAIVQAASAGGIRKVFSDVTSTTTKDNDLSVSDGNLGTALGDLSLGDWLLDYDFFLNGRLQRPGINAAADNDYYPGTDLDNSGDAQVKFEKTVKVGDVLAVLDRS